MTKNKPNNTLNNLEKKIKIMKGLEKTCYAGAIAGPLLLFAGDAIDNYNLSLIGAGLFVVAGFGALYTNTKRKELQVEQYWKEKRKEEENKIFYEPY